MQPPPVTSLGKYRIEATLGVGAMGVVYRAFDPDIERRVALKTIRGELFASAGRTSLMARFRNEAMAAGRLAHPHIVAIYDYGETDGTAWLAMEYVAGEGLHARIERGPALALDNTLAWFSQLLSALACAHEQQVVHRDIKPANLLVTGSGQLKVTDFGVAHIESSTLTALGSVVGTPSYMAPEQFYGEAVDGRSDLYSAAVVLYEMLTGVRPFVGAPAAVIQQMLSDPPRPPSLHNPALPAALDAVLLRALAKERAARFQTAAELHDALWDAMGGASQTGGSVARRLGLGATNTAALDADDDRTVVVAKQPVRCPRAEEHREQPREEPQRASTTSGSRPTLPASLPAADLAAIEARLAEQVGPVARLLIARAAAQASDVPTLGALLVAHIPSDEGRRQFTDSLAGLDGARSTHGTRGALRTEPATHVSEPTPPGTPSTLPHTEVTPEQIKAAALQLAGFLGPIAQLIVRREAAEARDLGTLHEQLAAAIRDEVDRASYRRATGLPPEPPRTAG